MADDQYSVDKEIERLIAAAEGADDERLRVLSVAVQDGAVREALSERIQRNDVYDGALIGKAEDGSFVVDFIFRRSAKSSFSLVPPRFRAVVDSDTKKVGRVSSAVGFEATDDMVTTSPNFSLDRLFVDPDLDLGGAVATYANGPTTYWV